MTNEIQIYNIKTTLNKDFITNEESVNNFLEEINSLKDIVFDFNNADDIKKAKELKTQANKSVKLLKEICEPYEAEGKKIANIRSKISTTLSTGKDNIIDQILKPINDAEKKLKEIKHTDITFPNIQVIDYKLKEFEELYNFNWLALKDEAINILNSLKETALLKKQTLQKEEEERLKEEERARKEREDAIRKEAEEKARIEADNRIKRELEEKERSLQLQKQQEELQAGKLKEEEERKANNIEHKRKVHNEIFKAMIPVVMTADGYLKDLIKAVAKGEIPHLYIKY